MVELPVRIADWLPELLPLDDLAAPGFLQTYALPPAVLMLLLVALVIAVCTFLPFNRGKRVWAMSAALVMLIGGIALATEDVGYYALWIALLVGWGRYAQHAMARLR